MNKAEFLEHFAQNAKITKAEASRMLDHFWRTVSESLCKGSDIRFVGIGTFKVVKVAAKTVTNPQNGKKINVPATKKPKFAPGKKLKEAVASSK